MPEDEEELELLELLLELEGEEEGSRLRRLRDFFFFLDLFSFLDLRPRRSFVITIITGDRCHLVHHLPWG